MPPVYCRDALVYVTRVGVLRHGATVWTSVRGIEVDPEGIANIEDVVDDPRPCSLSPPERVIHQVAATKFHCDRAILHHSSHG